MLTIFKKIPKRTHFFVHDLKVVRHFSPNQLREVNAEEIKIPVPWGHIAGKRWGVKNLKPVLCVHGWQDNANSFDLLIPHLPRNYCYVAIDFPGHGLSSHFPPGLFYAPIEFITVIRRVQMYFNWSSFAYIGHSFGGAFGFLYSSCFPKDISFFVAIENIKPLSAQSCDFVRNIPKLIEKLLSCDDKTIETAPLYSKEDLMEKWLKSCDHSLTERSCEILLERGAENLDGKYKLRRDCRVRFGTSANLIQKDILDMARKISCNVLYIKATNADYFEKQENVNEVLKVIKNNAKYFEHHELPGTHHIHLNNPEETAAVITKFIETVEPLLK